MSVRTHTPHPKSEFEARQGSHPGEVLLSVKRGNAGRTCFNWSWSTDQKSWVSTPTTLQAKTKIDNLTLGTVCCFRFQSVTKTGASDWSNPVSLTVR